jgi:hypothetical protein
MNTGIQVPRAPKTTTELKEEEELRRLGELLPQKRVRKRITSAQRTALGQDPPKPWKHFVGGMSTFHKKKKERHYTQCAVCGCRILTDRMQRHLNRAHKRPPIKQQSKIRFD